MQTGICRQTYVVNPSPGVEARVYCDTPIRAVSTTVRECANCGSIDGRHARLDCAMNGRIQTALVERSGYRCDRKLHWYGPLNGGELVEKEE